MHSRASAHSTSLLPLFIPVWCATARRHRPRRASVAAGACTPGRAAAGRRGTCGPEAVADRWAGRVTTAVPRPGRHRGGALPGRSRGPDVPVVTVRSPSPGRRSRRPWVCGGSVRPVLSATR
ncbi:hypothetical protein STXM2123_1482 [Streptomyces sp. F-3]|nr:hypothetical protein STXM2123_1482 [Streptomyces sp. F-3]